MQDTAIAALHVGEWLQDTLLEQNLALWIVNLPSPPAALSTLQLLLSFLREVTQVSLEAGDLLAFQQPL